MKKRKSWKKCLHDLKSSKEIIGQSKKEELIANKKEEKSKLGMKFLPSTLKYVFLEGEDEKPVIISSALTKVEQEKLVRVLKASKEAMA